MLHQQAKYINHFLDQTCHPSLDSLSQANLRYLHVLFLTILFPEAGQTLQLSSALPQSTDVSYHCFQLALSDLPIRKHSLFSQGTISSQFFDKEDKRKSNCSGRVLLKTQLKYSSFKQIFGQPTILFCELGVVIQKLKVEKRRGVGQSLKTDSEQNASFHKQDIFDGICVVANVNKILNFRHLVGLLIFGSNPQSCDAQELQFASQEQFDSEKRIDDFHCQIKGFIHQLVLLHDFHKPIQQNSSHMFGEVTLHFKVVAYAGQWLGYFQCILLNLFPVNLLLTNRRSLICELWNKWLVLREVLKVHDVLVIFRLDGTYLAIFHSKQQRITKQNLQALDKQLLHQLQIYLNYQLTPDNGRMQNHKRRTMLNYEKRMNIMKEEGGKRTSALPKSRQQIELPKISKHLPIDKNNFYQQRYEWLARSNDYVLLSNDQIHQEYQFLKRELIALSDEATTNDRANMKSLKHSRQLNVGSKNSQNKEREIENNNAIIYRLKVEYEQLQKRVYSNEGGKEEQGNIFAQIKQKMQKTRQKIKELKLKSKSIGEDIQNGQDIFAQVNKLQRQRDVQASKKAKMEEKLNFSQADLQRLQLKLQEINEQHSEAQRYLEGQSVYDRQDEEEKRLQNVHRQKSYQLQIVKKTIESTKNTKQQKCHQLLKQLQQIVDKLKERDEQLNKLEIKNMYQKKEIYALEETLQQLINIYKQRSKTTDNTNEPIFNGVDLDQILQRDNSQQQGMKRQKLPFMKKPASPGRSYRKQSDFSIDNFRINEQKRKDLSSRTQHSVISQVELNRVQQPKRSRESEAVERISHVNSENERISKLSTLINQNSKANVKSKSNQIPLNRGHYYKNYKSITHDRNQLLQKAEVTLITSIQEKNKFTFEQKLEQKQQMFEETIEQSSTKFIKNDPQQAPIVNYKANQQEITEVIEQQQKGIDQRQKQDRINDQEQEINKKKETINNYVSRFQEDDQIQDENRLQSKLISGQEQQNFN